MISHRSASPWPPMRRLIQTPPLCFARCCHYPYQERSRDWKRGSCARRHEMVEAVEEEADVVATALVVETAMAVTSRAVVALAVVEVVAEMVTKASGLAKVVEASQSRMGTASNRQSRNASSCTEPCTIERSLQVDREERAAKAATVAAVADKRVDKEAEAEGRVAAEAEWTIFGGGATRTTGRTGVGVCKA
jgi:hypothetical protein